MVEKLSLNSTEDEILFVEKFVELQAKKFHCANNFFIFSNPFDGNYCDQLCKNNIKLYKSTK